MNDELWLHPVKWWPFYWYSQAKCHYLYSKTGATNFSEAMFAPSWLLTSRLQTYKRISVAGYDIEDCMTSLYLSILGMLSLSPHQTLQQTAKTHQQTTHFSKMAPICSLWHYNRHLFCIIVRTYMYDLPDVLEMQI